MSRRISVMIDQPISCLTPVLFVRFLPLLCGMSHGCTHLFLVGGYIQWLFDGLGMRICSLSRSECGTSVVVESLSTDMCESVLWHYLRPKRILIWCGLIRSADRL